MCLIAFAWHVHAQQPLVVAANRDEFHARPTAAAHWWESPAGLFAGRDLEAGGAWCGMDRHGRFAAVTNVREPPAGNAYRSRGLLVRDYFAQSPAGQDDAADWATRMAAECQAFGPFNLLVGDRSELWFVSNRGPVRQRRLRAGVHAVSNGHWGDHWPKTERAQARLKDRLDADDTDPETLFTLLADTEPAHVATLPDTGFDTARERLLSPLFIRSERYGTRASTVIRRDVEGRIDFHERGFDADARLRHRVDEHWHIDKGPE